VVNGIFDEELVADAVGMDSLKMKLYGATALGARAAAGSVDVTLERS
jgi:hypothetical protein